ncbi:MAG: hypothetical protein U0P82_02260 [Vicinamibacterales bacterium]
MPFAEIVTFRQGYHLLDGLGRQRMRLDVRENLLVQQVGGEPHIVLADAGVPVPVAHILGASAVLPLGGLDDEASTAQTAGGQSGQQVASLVLRWPSRKATASEPHGATLDVGAPARHLMPEVIGDDAQLFDRGLDPLVGRSRLLVHLSPVIALATAVPDHATAIQIATQHGADGRG